MAQTYNILMNRFNGTDHDTLLPKNSLNGTTDPTTSTKGFIGQFYANISTNPAKVWQCVGESGGAYGWKEIIDVDAFTKEETLTTETAALYGEGVETPDKAFLAASSGLKLAGYATGQLVSLRLGPLPTSFLGGVNNGSAFAYGNGKIICARGTTVYYNTNGLSWASVSVSGVTNLVSVGFGGGKFVALPYDSDKGAYSSDGITWTAFTLPASGRYYDVAYGDGRFVASRATTYDDNRFAYSDDGITWTATNPLPTLRSSDEQSWSSVTYGDGKFVAVANLSGITVKRSAHSSDGITWSGATIADESWQTVRYGNGRFVATGFTNSAYSTDGVSWTTSSFNFTQQSDMDFGDGLFVATANGTSTKGIYYSTDGTIWIKSPYGSDGAATNVNFCDGRFLIVQDGVLKILSSRSAVLSNFAGEVQFNTEVI